MGKTKEIKNDKLEELIDKLETRLAIFNENELKQKCAEKLVLMNQTIQELQEQHRILYDLLGLTFSDIHYP